MDSQWWCVNRQRLFRKTKWNAAGRKTPTPTNEMQRPPTVAEGLLVLLSLRWSDQIKAIGIHHLVPGSDEVIDELLPVVVLGVDFGHRP